jgi:hypothetical protein
MHVLMLGAYFSQRILTFGESHGLCRCNRLHLLLHPVFVILHLATSHEVLQSQALYAHKALN